MTKDEKQCPFCAETIKKSAIKCRFCQSDIELTIESEKTKNTKSSSKNDYEVILLGIPLFSVIVIWVWCATLSLAEGGPDKLLFVFVTTILAIGAVVAKEVKDNEDKNVKFETPLYWFFCVSTVCVLFYPYYLKLRTKFGLKDRSVIGLMFMCLFLLISIGLFQSYNKTMSEIKESFKNLGNLSEGYQKNLAEILKNINIPATTDNGSNAYAEWTNYGTDDYGNLFFYDKSTIKRNGDKVQVYAYANVSVNENSMRGFVEFDCVNETFKNLSFQSFTKLNMEGEMMDETESNPKIYNIVHPSGEAELMKLVCKK